MNSVMPLLLKGKRLLWTRKVTRHRQTPRDSDTGDLRRQIAGLLPGRVLMYRVLARQMRRVRNSVRPRRRKAIAECSGCSHPAKIPFDTQREQVQFRNELILIPARLRRLLFQKGWNPKVSLPWMPGDLWDLVRSRIPLSGPVRAFCNLPC